MPSALATADVTFNPPALQVYLPLGATEVSAAWRWLLGHLDRWSCVLKSLLQVRPHPWKDCPQTIHEELPHGPRQPQSIGIHRTPEGIGVCLPQGREVRRKLRISRWTRYSLPRQHSLRPFWCNCGTLEQFVPASVLFRRFLAKDASVLA